MSQRHDYSTAGTPGARRLDWRRLAPGLGVALVLTGASAASLVHLADAWRAGAPVRAERARRDAERKAALLAPEAPPLDAAGAEAVPARGPSPILLPEVSAPPAVAAPRPVAIERSVRWIVRPAYTVRDSDLAPGVTRATAHFRCTLRPDGRLTGCGTSETPAGAGLAAAALPALAEARMEPMTIDGRPVESVATFSIAWERRARPLPPPPSLPSSRPAPPQPGDVTTRLAPSNDGLAVDPDPAAAAPPEADPAAD